MVYVVAYNASLWGPSGTGVIKPNYGSPPNTKLTDYVPPIAKPGGVKTVRKKQ